MAKSTKRRLVMILLDSNTIIYLSKKIIKIDDIFNDNDDYRISVITYMEILGYAFSCKEEELFIKKLLSFLNILYIDKNISEKVIELRKKYKIKLPDAIICATAINKNAILITNDIKLQNIEELKIKSIIFN
jgi:predicted nucleic acid-binding protein